MRQISSLQTGKTDRGISALGDFGNRVIQDVLTMDMCRVRTAALSPGNVSPVILRAIYGPKDPENAGDITRVENSLTVMLEA